LRNPAQSGCCDAPSGGARAPPPATAEGRRERPPRTPSADARTRRAGSRACRARFASDAENKAFPQHAAGVGARRRRASDARDDAFDDRTPVPPVPADAHPAGKIFRRGC